MCSGDEQRVTAFGNWALGVVFGSRRGEITVYWRKLHYEELQNLHAAPYIVRVIILRRMRWVAHVVRMGRRNSYSVLMGKPERNRSFDRHLHRLEDNIKMDLKK